MKHNLYKTFFIGAAVFLFIGCADKQTIDIEKRPEYQVPKQIAPPVANKGSLFTRKGPSLFADKKDLQIGDIVKVIIEIEETVEAGVEGDSNSDTIVSKGIGNFTGGSSAARRLNNAIGIGFDATSNSEFIAGANSKTTDKITDAFVSVVINEVYQNGNYFIQGSRETLILGQKLTVKISGVIRPFDIDNTDNSIESEKIANLKILYQKDGEEVDIIKKKWGTRIIDAIWPF